MSADVSVESQRASLRRRANAVVDFATAFLAAQFSESFLECVSIGLNGSCARGDLSPVSDIDYCIVFDGGHVALRSLDLGAIVQLLEHRVVGHLSGDELWKRFSVFWTTIEDLQSAQYRTGRFPPYDRGLFRESGRHVAGFELKRDAIVAPSQREIREDAVSFLLDEIRPRLHALHLFEESQQLSPAWVVRLGPVLVTKLVLMPVRLLYVLLQESESRPFVSVEAAVELCASQYGGHEWWTLVQEALGWRRSFPIEGAAVAHCARLLSNFTRQLYLDCIKQHELFATASGLSAASGELATWYGQLSSSYAVPDHRGR